jgi:hypothetical protein
MTRTRVLLLLLALAGTGCASSGDPATAGAAAPQPSRQNILLREEITASGVGNMQDAIQRLRPQFLRVRGQSSITQGGDAVAVYMDNVHIGGAEVLRTIGANGVVRVEYVAGPDTTFKFGSNHSAGVIHIVTK